MSFSNFLENKLLDHAFRNSSYTPATTVYLSLHTADPGETGASEVSGGSYARKAVAFNAASGGAIDNSAVIDFDGMPAVTVTHVGLWDASSAGNNLAGGAVVTPKTYGSGDTARIAISALDVTLD